MSELTRGPRKRSLYFNNERPQCKPPLDIHTPRFSCCLTQKQSTVPEMNICKHNQPLHINKNPHRQLLLREAGEQKSEKSSRHSTEERLCIIQHHSCSFSASAVFLQQHQILLDETNSSSDSRQKKKLKKEKKPPPSYLCVTVTHKNQNTHSDTHTEPVSGTTEVLWVAVSQILFLDARINRRPSLPRHRSRHAARWSW